MSDEKKDFLKYINSKSSSKENIELILVEDCHLTNRDAEKAYVFNVRFASIFLIILIGLGLPDPLSQRTTNVGTVTCHLWALRF